MKKRIVLAIIATTRTGSHSTGSLHQNVATLIGDFIYLDEAHVTHDDNKIDIQLSNPVKAYYLGQMFDRILITKICYRSYANLPKAELYLGDNSVYEYSPYDWYSEYKAFQFSPKDVYNTIQEVRTSEFNDVIITTDGGLYQNVKGLGKEYLLNDMDCIHGIL